MVEWAAMIPAVPVPDIPGQSVLACAGPATSTTVDRICGDGDDSYTDQSLGGDIGVLTSLRADDNQLRLRFDPLGNPSRHLTVFIPERFTPLTSNECVTNCLAAGTGPVIRRPFGGNRDTFLNPPGSHRRRHSARCHPRTK